MKITSTFKYWEGYLPSSRHRKLRWRESTSTVKLTVPEATDETAPVVFRIHDRILEKGVVDIRSYRGKLYSIVRCCDRTMGGSKEPWPVEKLVQYLENVERSGWASYRKDEPDGDLYRRKAIERIRTRAKEFLLVDNTVWTLTGEPMYCIYTFGLGHNHGGTALSIDRHYKPNISSSCYFNALQLDEAVKKAVSVALRRGDTDYVQYIVDMPKDNFIEVLDQSAVKRKPNKDHKNGGNKFMELAEALIEASSSKEEAAISTIALAMLNAAE